MKQPGEVWLTPAEVAARLRCSAPTVLRWIKAGELPARKIGRRRLIARSAVDAILAVAGKLAP